MQPRPGFLVAQPPSAVALPKAETNHKALSRRRLTLCFHIDHRTRYCTLSKDLGCPSCDNLSEKGGATAEGGCATGLKSTAAPHFIS